MNLSNLRADCPKTPEHIHVMIKQEVERQLLADNREVTKNKRSSWKSRRFIKIAAGIGAVLLATSGAVYAAERIAHFYANQVGNYGVQLGFSKDNQNEDSVQAEAIDEFELRKIQLNYLPEEYEVLLSDRDIVKYSNTNTYAQGGIAVYSYILGQEINSNEIEWLEKDIIYSEQIQVGNFDTIYMERNVTSGASVRFDKLIYAVDNEKGYILQIYAGQDLSKEETLKIVENIEMVPTGERIALEDAYTWEDYVAFVAKNNNSESNITSSSMGCLPTQRVDNIYNIGEEFVFQGFAVTGGESGIVSTGNALTAKVTNVQIADNLDLLTQQDSIPREWLQSVEDDGTLCNNVIQYISSGDGINQLDTVVYTEEVEQKLVYVTIDITNTSEEEWNQVIILGKLETLINIDDSYKIYNRAWMDGNPNTSYTVGTSAATTEEMVYLEPRRSDGKNYIATLMPGETVTVHMAWIVNADDLDKLYFNLDMSSTNSGGDFVDIRQ